jgi:hypothetical protein
MALNIKQLLRRAKKYVEIEARTQVTRARFVETFSVFGREDVVLSVSTTDRDDPEWWVIGGSTPMNLYSKRRFPSPDEAFSFHTGLMLRLFRAMYQNQMNRQRRLATMLSYRTQAKTRTNWFGRWPMR